MVDRCTTGRKLIVYDDQRLHNTAKGKVFAAAHVGRYDIESVMEAIGEQAYFIMGDPEETYRNFEGFFLDKMYGRICLDTGYQIYDLFQKRRAGMEFSSQEKEIYEEYRRDRHICEVTATRRVKRGDNILIFPEGAWNITPRMVQPIFPGAAKMAVNGDGVLVPIGVLRQGKTYSVNIGREIDVSGANQDDIDAITTELKERICALTAEMIFSGEITQRSSLPSAEENERAFVADIMSESENGYTENVIRKTRYYNSNAPENVFLKTQIG